MTRLGLFPCWVPLVPGPGRVIFENRSRGIKVPLPLKADTYLAAFPAGRVLSISGRLMNVDRYCRGTVNAVILQAEAPTSFTESRLRKIRPRTAIGNWGPGNRFRGLPANQDCTPYILYPQPRQAPTGGANSTLDRNPSRQKSRGGPTGRPLICVAIRHIPVRTKAKPRLRKRKACWVPIRPKARSYV